MKNFFIILIIIILLSQIRCYNGLNKGCYVDINHVTYGIEFVGEFGLFVEPVE